MNTSHPALSRAAERQMRNWAFDLQTQQRVAEEREHTHVKDLIHPYLVISRETGTDAEGLAQAIAARCGWKLLDRELLDYMAEHEHFSRLALDFVDERTVSWFHEVFGKWLDKGLVSQAEYVSRMGKLVLLAAQHESTIFIGRGIQFMLPRQLGLRVRIIAPTKQRIETIMGKRQCGEQEARSFVEKTDDERAQFVQRYFHRDVADPHLYDLIINLAHIPREDAVDLIATEAMRHQDRARANSLGRAALAGLPK
jgi:cytidylate kinase